MNRLRSLIPHFGHFFTQTLGVRFLLALALSVILWVIFTAEQNPVREDFFSAEIPVETSRLGDGLVVSRMSPGAVRLRISAPRDMWESLSADNFRVGVDLFAVGVGLHEIPISAISSDSTVRIMGTDPETVTVALEERKEKEVPVRVNLAGSPPQGYDYQPPEFIPDIVTVIGPASRVELVDSVWIDVELEGAESTVNLTQRAIPRDAQGQDVSGVQLDPAVVQVTVPVEQVTSYKDVPVRVSIEGQPAPGYWIARYLATPPSATLVGRPPDLDQMDFVFTEAVSVEGATQTFTATAELQRPADVGISGSDQVEVTVEVLPIQSSVETQVVVTHVNLQPGMSVLVNPATVDVLLSGPAPVLRTLEASSVIISLNLSGVGPGSYALTPNSSTPPQVQVERISPPQLQVVVRPLPTPTPQPATTPTPTSEPLPASPTPGS